MPAGRVGSGGASLSASDSIMSLTNGHGSILVGMCCGGGGDDLGKWSEIGVRI